MLDSLININQRGKRVANFHNIHNGLKALIFFGVLNAISMNGGPFILIAFSTLQNGESQKRT